jgi:hypothetical protein
MKRDIARVAVNQRGPGTTDASADQSCDVTSVRFFASR